jgi:hypothetical protein
LSIMHYPLGSSASPLGYQRDRGEREREASVLPEASLQGPRVGDGSIASVLASASLTLDSLSPPCSTEPTWGSL